MAEFVWNGLGVTTPDAWEPAAIERDGLVLEAEGHIVCELKWSRIHGSFSFDKHIRKVTRGNKKAAVSGVADNETPPAWGQSLSILAESGLRTRSFIWQADGVRGIGAALHNPGTGLAALVQFFIRSEADEDRAATVLASLRDYSSGKTVPWIMFGLSARVPAEFVLDTFSFQPGHYRVVYWRPKSRKADRLPPGKGPGTRLVFDRFAPASVVLRQSALSEWVSDNVEDTPKSSFFAQCESGVEWDAALKSSLLRTALRREVRSRGRAWTTETGNAILSVCASGVVPVPESLFIDMCGSFALVQETTS